MFYISKYKLFSPDVDRVARINNVRWLEDALAEGVTHRVTVENDSGHEGDLVVVEVGRRLALRDFLILYKKMKNFLSMECSLCSTIKPFLQSLVCALPIIMHHYAE